MSNWDITQFERSVNILNLNNGGNKCIIILYLILMVQF